MIQKSDAQRGDILHAVMYRNLQEVFVVSGTLVRYTWDTDGRLYAILKVKSSYLKFATTTGMLDIHVRAEDVFVSEDGARKLAFVELLKRKQ